MSTTAELLIDIANNIPQIYTAGRESLNPKKQQISVDTVSFDSNFSSGLTYLPHTLGAKPEFAVLYANNVENAKVPDATANVILTFSFLGGSPAYVRQDSNGVWTTSWVSAGRGIILEDSTNSKICVAPIAGTYPFPSKDYTDFTLICTCRRTQEATTNDA